MIELVDLIQSLLPQRVLSVWHCRALAPAINWAQRKDIVYVTIELDDITDEQHKMTEKKFTFE